MNSRRLFNVFEAYTGGTPSITSMKFLKLMKDADLVDNGFQQADVDLIFTKNKEKGQRNLGYDGFKKSLEMVATKKQVSSKDLAEFIILKCGAGPRLTGTQAQENRFYDDKTTYTGVHKSGGPTIVDKEKITLNQLLDRSSADVRGLKQNMKESYHRDTSTPKRGDGRRHAPPTPSSSGSQSGVKHLPTPPTHNQPDERHSVSQSHGHGLGEAFVPPPVPQQHYHDHSSYQQNQHTGFDENAMLNSLENRLRRTSLSSSTGSSGVTQSGGYQNHHDQQNHQYNTPPQHSHHDHQHRLQEQQQQHQRQGQGQGQTYSDHQQGLSSRNQQVQPHHERPHHQTRQMPVDKEKELYRIYRAFCVNPESAEMDSTKYVKLCKDVGFIGRANYMTTTDADLIFQKTKRSGNYGKRICYEDFRMVAIPEMAKRMQCQPDDVISHIVMSDGPSLNNVTVAADVRFHDDVKTYTGVKAVTGGVNPSFSVESNRVAMEDLLDRTEADMRGVKLSSDTQHTKHSKKNMVMAGEANKKGGIYDRLSDQKSYTGVYKERFNPNASGGDGHYDISQMVQRR